MQREQWPQATSGTIGMAGQDFSHASSLFCHEFDADCVLRLASSA
jgi:hypothetical protein